MLCYHVHKARITGFKSEIYHAVHVNVQDNFYINRRGVKHVAPKMERMLQQVCHKIHTRPQTSTKTQNVLLRGIKNYIRGDDINENEEGDDEDDNGITMEKQTGMDLTEDDFFALEL